MQHFSYDLIVKLSNIQLNCSFTLMRPQSAKPDFKRNMRQSSAEQVNQQHFQKQQQRKQVRLIKPDLTSHDYSRILPQKIQQDKQRLYSQALKLKQMLNQTSQENIKLKTKISVLEKEKDKINKYIQTAPQGLGGKMSRINLYGNRSLQKDNMITRNLKKLIREGRQQNDTLRMENNKIKKMMKYTKINELQILLQTIVQENKKLNQIVRDYAEYASNHEQIQQQNENLKKYIEEQISQREKYAQQRERYEEIIDQLQEQLKSQKQRHNNKQSKMVNQLRAEKRRGNDLQRKNQQLSRVIKSLRDNVEYLQQRNKNASKNIVKVSKSLKNSNNNQKITTQKSQQSIGLQKNYIQVMEKNKQLQKQLDQSTSKLKQASNRIKQLQQYMSKTSKLKIDSDQSGRQIEKHQGDEYINKEYLEVNEDSYKEQFEEEQNNQNIDKERQQSQLQSLKKQFQQSQEQQQIFKKNDSKTNKQKKKKSNPKKSPQKQTKKSNKKLLSQIRQLLTYRMKAQRYPFTDIKQDILKSQTNTFSFSQLSNMLVNQPFYLTQQYAQVFLSFCFQKDHINPIDSISNKFLVDKLRKVIDDFELMQEQDEKQMIIRISQMTSTYPQHLQAAFENMQNGQGTISKKDLIQMFEKLQLEKEYIDLIIAQLSLYSSDLQHLNYNGFFERFFIEDDDENYAIEEQGQQSQQSKRHSSRVNKSSQKIQKHHESEQIDDL